ncbi:MAG: hypothetical protein OEZ06_16060 [Myxococcales bacterium]|nr:hypothetical protein [Myxococcales bacterium]
MWTPGSKTWALVLGQGLSLLLGCGARQAQPTTSGGGDDVVVEQALVVEGRKGAVALPPLPQALEHSSEDFRRGHGLAQELLAAAGPGQPPTDDRAAYEAWTQGEFTGWLEGRAVQTRTAVDALGAVQKGPPSEHVVAAALVGLIYERLAAQLLAVPPPAAIAAEAKLERHYRKGLDDAATEWRTPAERAFFHCAKGAALQTDAAYGLWLELCHDHLARLREQTKAAESLAAALEAEANAELLAAAGPPPAGPEVCFRPNVHLLGAGAGDDAAEVTTAGAEAGTESAASASGSTAKAPKSSPCAEQTPPPPPPAPRDAREALYGLRDASNGVRVSIAVPEDPNTDLRGLGAAESQGRLTDCFAKHVKENQAVTVAVHARLSVAADGRITAAEIRAEPSEQNHPPERPLRRCLETALKKTALACNDQGQATQATALICLRRD